MPSNVQDVCPFSWFICTIIPEIMQINNIYKIYYQARNLTTFLQYHWCVSLFWNCFASFSSCKQKNCPSNNYTIYNLTNKRLLTISKEGLSEIFPIFLNMRSFHLWYGVVINEWNQNGQMDIPRVVLWVNISHLTKKLNS